MSCNNVSACSGNTAVYGYNASSSPTNSSSETLLQMFYHLLETVCLLLDTLRECFPFINNIRKVISLFLLLPPYPQLLTLKSLSDMIYANCLLECPALLRAQGTSHLTHQLCEEGINKKDVKSSRQFVQSHPDTSVTAQDCR